MSTELSRRDFLKIGGAAAAGAGMAVAGVAEAAPANVDTSRTVLPYPTKTIARANELPMNEAVPFNYPDESSPCAVIRTGKAVKGGVGPQGDIVAYSTLCTHMGCPVNYDPNERSFKCPCHFSMFDAEQGGQMICGQATEDLPRIKLSYNAQNDTVTAVGIEGLIYGRQANVL